ncbi:MAG: DUF6580 family putative transport protein [Candidatus Omnitrophota bacterium]
MWLSAIFISIAILSRLIPHVPNFSPLVGVALFAGVYWNKKNGFLLPLAMYIISDLIIGLHNTVLFTWSSIVIIYALGVYLRKHKSVTTTVAYTFISAVIFFIISNFGVWLMGWYPRTMAGLVQCFYLALPFFRMSLLADFVYVAVLFGAYEFFLAKHVLARESL